MPSYLARVVRRHSNSRVMGRTHGLVLRASIKAGNKGAHCGGYGPMWLGGRWPQKSTSSTFPTPQGQVQKHLGPEKVLFMLPINRGDGARRAYAHEPWRCRLKPHRRTFSEAHHPRTLSSLRRLPSRTSEIQGFPVVQEVETKGSIRTDN